MWRTNEVPAFKLQLDPYYRSGTTVGHFHEVILNLAGAPFDNEGEFPVNQQHYEEQ